MKLLNIFTTNFAVSLQWGYHQLLEGPSLFSNLIFIRVRDLALFYEFDDTGFNPINLTFWD